MAREKKQQRGKRRNQQPKEFEERLLEIRRVTRVTTGGRRMSFRATVVIGNGKGKIGIGTAKGTDVAVAVRKATREAHKEIITVPVTENRSVPYALTLKNKACIIKLIPAAPGTGLKAGSSLRAVLELAGYENILSKIVGANNKLNVALTTFKALSTYKHADHFSAKSGKKNEKTEEKEGTEEKKTPVKKTATKKPAAKKTPAKKTATKKTSTKKTPAKKKPAAKKETEKDT